METPLVIFHNGCSFSIPTRALRGHCLVFHSDDLVRFLEVKLTKIGDPAECSFQKFLLSPLSDFANSIFIHSKLSAPEAHINSGPGHAHFSRLGVLICLVTSVVDFWLVQLSCKIGSYFL